MERSTRRPPAVAGTFYPASRQGIERALDKLLGGARHAAEGAAPHRLPKALIVPHAGWIYSGPIAATAFARLADDAGRISRVVLLGPAHRACVDGLAATGASAMATPLGEVPVDEDAVADLGAVAELPAAHAREHCLEVELPFLQRLLPRAHVVPLLVGDAPPEVVGHVLERLWGGDETLVVVSSDLSHYLPYETARAVDADTAERICALVPVEAERACGAAAINGLLWVARRKGLQPRLLDLRSSGDTAGGRDEVVGYGAFALDEEPHACA